MQGVRSLGWAAAALLTLSVAARADTTITTVQDTTISSWGITNTATYGQTVTAPVGESFLTSFTFTFVSFASGSTSIPYQAHVYAWNGTQATGPSLFSSGVLNSPAAPPQSVTVNTGFVPVTPGNEYVLFFSTSGLQDQVTPSQYVWGGNSTNSYTGGEFVFLNNGDDPSAWTTSAWSTFNVADTAFTATFVGGASAAPEPGTLALLALGVVGGIAARRRK